MPSFSEHSTVIIGAGISGLATAWWLHKKGHDVVVLEKETTVGGTIKTIHDNGWLVECGPNSALETTPLFKTLFADLGILDELMYAADAATNRYIVRDGVLHPLPMSPTLFLKSKLWTLAGKLRLLKEPFVGRATKDESIAEFVERRLGKEFLDYAINPFVAGVYAGNPEELSVRAAFPKLYALEEKYGGLIKGQIAGAKERKKRAEQSKDRAQLFSFRKGLQTLPDALAQALGKKIITNAVIQSVRVQQNAEQPMHEITVTSDEGETTYRARNVIFAIPSYAAAQYIQQYDSALSEKLNSIYYPPIAEIVLGYHSSQIKRPLDGFGYLIPAKEKRNILGTIWSSVLFPERAPEGCVAFTTFVGGSRQPELVQRDEKELRQLTVDEVRQLMNIDGEPIYSRVTRWAKAIPQYRLGHLQIIDHVQKFEDTYPGIFFTGNFRGGIAVGDCVIHSEKIAERVLSRNILHTTVQGEQQ